MTPEQAVEEYLREEPYLQRHFANGDDGIPGYIAGAVYSRCRHLDGGSSNPSVDDLQRAARKVLGRSMVCSGCAHIGLTPFGDDWFCNGCKTRRRRP